MMLSILKVACKYNAQYFKQIYGSKYEMVDKFENFLGLLPLKKNFSFEELGNDERDLQNICVSYVKVTLAISSNKTKFYVLSCQGLSHLKM
jgi:hypothetical protein